MHVPFFWKPEFCRNDVRLTYEMLRKLTRVPLELARQGGDSAPLGRRGGTSWLIVLVRSGVRRGK